MHRISIIFPVTILIIFALHLFCIDAVPASSSSSRKQRKEAAEEQIYYLEIPDNVIIEHHNATDYIKTDNVKHRAMGVSDERCDNANYNLFIDFDPKNETEIDANTKCYENSPYPFDGSVEPLMVMLQVPENYMPVHRCMKMIVTYSERIPLIGPHRPLWARYGEYMYLPPQRWLHNIEHGGIVLLYHPCADPNQLSLFKDLVKKCLFRHIITPYKKLTRERPFALLGWSASLEFSFFDFELSRDFIRFYARSGPERMFRDGQYRHLLIEKAKIVKDVIDSTVCPDM